jgi:hypothetical protein
MAEESKLVEATAGPYKGQRITLPTADADAAMAAGWAVDPFAPPPNAEELANRKPPTEEELARANEAAQTMARKLRGDEDANAMRPAPEAAPPSPRARR